MLAKLIIMSGVPGSGKSTFIKKHFKGNNIKVVSRDEIRFSIVAENEEYFSKENEVWKEFITQIQNGLDARMTVIADATHLNENSRKKLLNSLKMDWVEEVILYFFEIPIEICLNRNEERKGTRAYVPREVIRRMKNQLTEPLFENFDHVFIVDEEGDIIERVYDIL